MGPGCYVNMVGVYIDSYVLCFFCSSNAVVLKKHCVITHGKAKCLDLFNSDSPSKVIVVMPIL